MYTIGSLWVLHWSSWGWYQKPSAGASLHPFARRVSTSFLDHLGEKRFFLKLSTIWLGFVSQLYMPRCLFKMYICCFIEFYRVRFVAPLECDQAFFVLETKPVTQVNIATSEGLGLRQDLLLFSNQPHRSTWKPSTFVQVWTIIWVRIFYTLKSPHAHPLSRR